MEKVRALCRQTLAAVVRVVTTWQTALQARLTISSISRSKKVSTTSCRHTNKVPQLWQPKIRFSNLSIFYCKLTILHLCLSQLTSLMLSVTSKMLLILKTLLYLILCSIIFSAQGKVLSAGQQHNQTAYLESVSVALMAYLEMCKRQHRKQLYADVICKLLHQLTFKISLTMLTILLQVWEKHYSLLYRQTQIQ